ncbi:MAG: Hsp33 family molecular chaperone [Pseudomonadota bacterium]
MSDNATPGVGPRTSGRDGEAVETAVSTATPPAVTDDLVVPFRLEASGALGRLARLGCVVDGILKRHDYPDPVSIVLGEALVLAAILGAGLKNQSRFTLQTQTDGPINFLVVNFDWPDGLRGYATFDAEHFAQEPEVTGSGNGALLGSGHMAMTIIPGSDTPGEMGQQYQGIVAMEGQSLIDAAHTYFVQSEQLPTALHVAVAKHFDGAVEQEPGGPTWRWRAGGIIAQKLTWEGGKKRAEVAPELANDLPPEWEDDDDWMRTRALASTVEAHELTDPLLSPEQLLFRLFHEEGVRVFEIRGMAERCSCSRERIESVLARFPPDEIEEMEREDGDVQVTCEFCGRVYTFDKIAVAALSGDA